MTKREFGGFHSLEEYKEYHRKYNRKYMKESRIKNRDMFIERDRKWRENNPKKRLLMATKQSAKLKGLEHNIDETDLDLPEYCPLIGIRIDYTAGNGKTMIKPSVDRIDSTKGYIKGNVEVVSSRANTMKCNATVEELQYFALEILRRYPLENVGN